MQTTVERPAESAGELYFRTPVTPEEAFQAIGRLRKEARDEIDRLIRFLDKTDDYVSRELEDSIDDNRQGDNELDGPENEEDEDDDPAEPSLGSTERGEWANQESWAVGGRQDLEDEHDGAEPPEDDEPSLGSFEGLTLDQEVAYMTAGEGWSVVVDAELDPAERSGIGDLDGLLEQIGCGGWQGDRIGMV